MKEKGFDIIILSDTQYEELCAEIYFDGQFVAIITQEEGKENSIIEFDPPKSVLKWIFKYSDFIDALKEAQNCLEKMKKSDE